MPDHDMGSGAQPRTAFDAPLAGDERVRLAIIKHFGPEADVILCGMRDGQTEIAYQEELNDLLLDLFTVDGKIVSSFEGKGNLGTFPITVKRFGPVFWISAEQFDDIGYFDDLVTAIETAAENYEPFITAASIGGID